jgi:DNA-binding transcriptional regulator YiaG
MAIKRLRTSLGKTQDVFAQLVGTTKKAVESWESGTRKPSGSALRLFQILEKNVHVVEDVSYGKDENGPASQEKPRAT